jgi:Putative peptidase family
MRGFTVLALVFGPFSMAIAGTAPRQQALTVVVGDHVGIEGSTLRKAVGLAKEILRNAGVSTELVSCSSRESEGVSMRQCLSGIGLADLGVWILPKAAPGHPVPRTAMGMALPGNSGEFGTTAYVYYDRVLRAAEFSNGDALRILGHAIAHEIGHLLGSQHSHSGIMRADWTRGALMDMSRGHVLFSPDEARRMEANVAARVLLLRAAR